MRNPGLLLPGDLVQVKSPEEIYRTLDARGCRDGMPFMPEMLDCCGKTFRVWRRVEKTCVEGDRVRRLRRMVFLGDLRCNGSAHGGCEKECRIFWHEDWLARVEAAGATSLVAPAKTFPYPVFEQERYRCQSTELIRASTPMSRLDLRQYLRDLKTRTWRIRELMRFVGVAIGLRAKALLLGVSSVKLTGSMPRTPTSSIGLRPGDFVRVKSREEIAATLDRRGCNRGLEFSVYMLPFMGRIFRVQRPVRRIILETTGEMKELKNTVSLACATCNGHGRWGGCPRDQFHLWRENWLERVPEHAASHSFTRLDDDEWDAFVTAHADGTVYHLSAWRRAMEATYPHIQGSFFAMPNGHGWLAGLPAYVVNSRWLGRWTVCAPYATKCGPLLADGVNHRDVAPLIHAILDQHHSHRFEFRAHFIEPDEMEDLRFQPSALFKHHYLHLGNGPDELMRHFSRTNVRQRIRRAGEEGITARDETGTDGLAAFYMLFTLTRRRLGLPAMSLSFFNNLLAYLPAGTVQVIVARRSGCPEAALFALRYKGTLHFEYGGSHPDAAASGANQLVWWSAMRRACEEGLHTVSLGCTDRDNEGLLAYKRHWGAEEEDVATLVMRRRGAACMEGSRRMKDRDAVRWFFRHAPEALCETASRVVYRHWG